MLTINRRTTMITTFLSLGFIAEAALAQMPRDLRVVKPADFCQRVTNIMMTLGTQQGLDVRGSTRMAGKATSNIMTQLKSGKMNPFMDAQSAEMSAAPAVDPGATKSDAPTKMWFSIPEVLVSAMGRAPKRVVFIDDVNDLRYISQTMPQSQVLLLASGAGELNSERARLVAQTSQALGLEVDIIWVGKSRDPRDVRAAQGLALIAAMTNGAFMDLGADGSCGGT
jgi:hypothetical protein